MDNAQVLSLVYLHINSSPENYSWVPHYKKRTNTGEVTCGGHYRRKALCLRTLRALNCTAKFYKESVPMRHYPPVKLKGHHH